MPSLLGLFPGRLGGFKPNTTPLLTGQEDGPGQYQHRYLMVIIVIIVCKYVQYSKHTASVIIHVTPGAIG